MNVDVCTNPHMSQNPDAVGSSISLPPDGEPSVTPEPPVEKPPEPPKKSWADLAKPKESEPSSLKSSSGKASRISATPFVITHEESVRAKFNQKCTRLGEVLVSKNLNNQKLDHRTIFLTPRGMINRGNACYANAVLQALVFCPPFFHLLESLDVEPDYPESLQEFPPITGTFVQLAKEFQKIPTHVARKSHLGREEPPLDPSFVYLALERHGTEPQKHMLAKNTQEDAQEFLNHVLLLIHEEMAKGLISLGVEGNSGGGKGNDEWTSISKNQKKTVIRESNDFKPSPVANIFCGKLRSLRSQQRGQDYGNLEPFFMLGLPIQDAKVKSVFNALECFMQRDYIHGFQDRGREVSAFRQYRFAEVPAVLILHLKYFEFSSTGGLAKLQKTIDFEPTLKLPERWFAEGFFNASKSVYKLFAVVFHYGEGTEGGHYTACFFHPSAPQGWIEANDSAISVVNFDYMRNPQFHRVPYLLFYRLQPNIQA